MKRFQWVIVGGGVHGTFLGNVLLNQAKIPRDSLLVLDQERTPLAAFWRATSATGMQYLRSPGVHNLGIDPFNLFRFAKNKALRSMAKFAAPYDRPSLRFFRAHCEQVIGENQLQSVRQNSVVHGLTRHRDGYNLHTSDGIVQTANVVLAMGVGQHICLPVWSQSCALANQVVHVFDKAFFKEKLLGLPSIAVIGGGISAVQLACALADQGSHVTMIARHPLRVHQFDSDPSWLGPKSLTRFQQSKDYTIRRSMITSARNRGSVPTDIAQQLQTYLQAKKVEWFTANISKVTRQTRPFRLTHRGTNQVSLPNDRVSSDGPKDKIPRLDTLRIELDSSPDTVYVNKIVLATGFESYRPGGEWVDRAVEDLKLPCAECGYPVVDSSLAWAPGLYVSGPLAELELGPSARNIAGARAAGKRILQDVVSAR